MGFKVKLNELIETGQTELFLSRRYFIIFFGLIKPFFVSIVYSYVHILVSVVSIVSIVSIMSILKVISSCFFFSPSHSVLLEFRISYRQNIPH